jgi:hypothetical protein
MRSRGSVNKVFHDSPGHKDGFALLSGKLVLETVTVIGISSVVACEYALCAIVVVRVCRDIVPCAVDRATHTPTDGV